jgi:hypothetical protein
MMSVVCCGTIGLSVFEMLGNASQLLCPESWLMWLMSSNKLCNSHLTTSCRCFALLCFATMAHDRCPPWTLPKIVTLPCIV